MTNRLALAFKVLTQGTRRPPATQKSAPYIFPTFLNGQPNWIMSDFGAYVNEGYSLNSVIYSAVSYKARAIAKARLRATKTSVAQPATVVRLGHCVLGVSDFRASEAWYKARFGFITSDEIAVAPNFSIGAFMRCDRGDTPTDHHTLFLLQGPGGASFNHAAFEVVDLDDLMHGHDHLKAKGRDPDWGVGRHILGSQIFDYWRDPWGHTLEHWTDGDLFTAADGSNIADLPTLMGVQWGMKMPARG